MKSAEYDVIVIGTGGVGSSAVYHLAKRGIKVLGLDRFPAGHDRGSSHGQTRVIRKAYFEHPNYVPLLRRAYGLWETLERETKQVLFQKHDLVEVGPSDGIVVPGVLKAAGDHGLKVDSLSESQFSNCFPRMALPPGSQALLENDAGFLFVEKCVLAHLEIAESNGAVLETGNAVVGWKSTGNGIEVETGNGSRFTASRLIITTGPWAGQFLDGSCGVKLKVLRKHLHWYESDDTTAIEAGFPVFFYETDQGFFYGFPKIDGQGLKVAEHSRGEVVEGSLLEKDTSLDESDVARVEEFLTTHISGVSRKRTRHEVCYYTMSPDGDFIVDRHPENPDVFFAAGLSGHGFKFASVLGEILTDFAEGKQSDLPVDFLRLDRLIG